MSYNRLIRYYLFVSMITIGGIAFGYNISIIASALPKISSEYVVSEKMLSLISGLVFAGMVSAKMVLPFFTDNYGRRVTLLLSSIVFILGTSFMIFPLHMLGLIIIGRILQGFGGGLLMFTTSLYIIEVAHDNMRGKFTALYQLSFTLGLLLANIIGLFVFNINWRINFKILMFLTFVFSILVFFLPCSPKWLSMKGRINEAKIALSINHKEYEIEQVLNSWIVIDNVVGFGNIFKRRYLKSLFLVVLITFLHQLTGINAILQTSTLLISQAGLARYAALYASIGITLVNVIGTFIGLQLINRFPRNKMLGYCGLTIAFAHFIVAINFFSGFNSPLILLGGLVLFMASYSIGPGIIIWLVFSEYLPTTVRSKGIAIAGVVNSFAGFIISSLFLHLTFVYGISWVFLICALFSVLYGVIPLLYLPDTQGKNIEVTRQLFKS